MRRWLTTLFGLAAVAAAAPAPRSTPALPRFAAPPLWQLDLSTLGDVPGRRLARLDAASAGLHPLVFSTPGRLAVAFLTYAAPPQLTPRGRSPETPLRLHLAVLDAASGRVLARNAWTVPNVSVDVVAAPGGEFVLVEPRLLTRLSPDLQPLATRRLPPLAGFEANQRVLAAPGGATFALSLIGPNWTEDRWVRSADLAVLADRQGDRVLAVGDAAIVRQLPVRARRLTGAQALARERAACASPRPPPPLTAATARLPVITLTAVCSPAGGLLGAAPPGLDATGLEGFLANGWLAMREFPGMALYDTAFRKLRERRPQHGATAYGAPAAAAAGGWFALPVWTAAEGMSVLDMQGFARLDRLAIGDAAGDRWLELKTKGRKVGHLNGLALSPDATKFAVLYNRTLQVYAVPPAAAKGWQRFDNRKRKR